MKLSQFNKFLSCEQSKNILFYSDYKVTLICFRMRSLGQCFSELKFNA